MEFMAETESEWQFDATGNCSLLGEWLDAAGIDSHAPDQGYCASDRDADASFGA